MTAFGSDAGPLRVGCVVLAAGRGSRFGEPKAGALVRPGVRFIDAVVRTASEAGADPVVAVVQPGTEVPAPGRAVFGNADDEQIGSVRRGLAALANATVGGTLLWPVDHPYVTVEDVLVVIDAAKRKQASIVVPLHDGRRGHPAFFARETWPALMTVENGGARAVVQRYGERVHEVAAASPGVLRDIDTRRDVLANGNTRSDG